MGYSVLFLDRSPGHPAPLPTPNDINGSETLLHEATGSRVVRLPHGFVVKYGIYVSAMEARNMQFVASSTTMPVPKVYAVYQRKDKDRVATYM